MGPPDDRDESPTSAGGSPASPSSDLAAESTIRRALMVGNFQAAVDACFESGMMAEALLLASCGGAELWSSTQAKYFEREARKRPFLHLLSAIIKSDLSELVQKSELDHWQETLAVLSTYAKTEEFGPLCAQLGKRLDEERSDKASASLCYMCAVDLGQTARYWIDEFKQVRGLSMFIWFLSANQRTLTHWVILLVLSRLAPTQACLIQPPCRISSKR